MCKIFDVNKLKQLGVFAIHRSQLHKAVLPAERKTRKATL